MTDNQSPFEPLIRYSRGKKTKRAVWLVLIFLVAYFARYAPQELMNHMFEIVGIVLGLTIVDGIQEVANGQPTEARVMPSRGTACPSCGTVLLIEDGKDV